PSRRAWDVPYKRRRSRDASPSTCSTKDHLRGQRNHGAVGLTYVRIELAKDAVSPFRSVEVLVDTGATYSMIPRTLLEALGVVPTRSKTIRLGDGRTMDRGLGLAYVRYETHETP